MATAAEVVAYAANYGLSYVEADIKTIFRERAISWVARQSEGQTIDSADVTNAEAAYTLHLMAKAPTLLQAQMLDSFTDLTFGSATIKRGNSSISGGVFESWEQIALSHLIDGDLEIDASQSFVHV
jgi:hypothetical protein